MQITLGHFQATDLMRQYMTEVLDSGRLSYGPKCRLFESEFALQHECRHGVLSNSGTSSLVVAIQTLKEQYGWEDEDEVICPALTFVATINAVLHNKLTPVLVDVESDYYNINAHQIRLAVTPRTRATLPVHLFGQPANMPIVLEVAWENDLLVIEDSCETVHATIDGRSVGSFGDIACFSMYTAHHVVMGVGGIATTNSPLLASHMRSLVNHGLALDNMPNGEEYDPSFLGRNFTFDKIGHSFRITEMEAAIGLAQLDQIHSQVFRRQNNAEHLYRYLQPVEDVIQLPEVRPNATHSWMVFPIVLKEEDKSGLKRHLRENGIEVRDMVPLTNQPCYRDIFEPSHYPVADWINRCGLYIGCHQHMTPEHMQFAAKIIKQYFGR